MSSILITSKAGDVLIDGGLPDSAKQIRDHIRVLGFRIEDVKLIVNSHVHFDHAGGIAKLQRWSHARVAASESSAAVMRKGGLGRDDPQYGILPPIAKVKRVERLRDGETLRIGDIAITAHLTPGHTPGGTSWTWKSCEGERCVDMVYADSLTPVSAPGFKFSTNSQALRDFEKSFSFLENVPCDILITTHPDVSGLWAKVERRGQGATPDPMIDTNACRNVAANAESSCERDSRRKALTDSLCALLRSFG